MIKDTVLFLFLPLYLTLIVFVSEVEDCNPLRRWRICFEVPATPAEMLQRLLKERPLWQTDLKQEKVLEVLDKQTDVYQYSCRNMVPQSSSDYVVLRSGFTLRLPLPPLYIGYNNIWTKSQLN